MRKWQEHEKNSHPVASKIPDNLWDSYFRGRLKKEEIEASQEYWRENIINLPPEKRNKTKMLTLALVQAQDDQQAKSDVQYAVNTLYLRHERILEILASLGRVEMMDWYVQEHLSDRKLREWFENKNYDPVLIAVWNENCDVLDWLDKQVSRLKPNISNADFFTSFGDCRIYPKSSILIRLLEMAKENLSEKCFEEVCTTAFIRGASSGQLDALKWIKENTEPSTWDKIILSDDCGGFIFAAEHGHYDVVDYLCTNTSAEIYKKAMFRAENYSALFHAMDNHHDKVVYYLLNDRQCLEHAKSNRGDMVNSDGESYVEAFLRLKSNGNGTDNAGIKFFGLGKSLQSLQSLQPTEGDTNTMSI